MYLKIKLKNKKTKFFFAENFGQRVFGSFLFMNSTSFSFLIPNTLSNLCDTLVSIAVLGGFDRGRFLLSTMMKKSFLFYPVYYNTHCI